MDAEALPLALTMGDPAGIGGELTLAAWERARHGAGPVFVVLDDPARLAALAARLGRIDPVLIPAARGLGATRLGAFRRVTWPLARPAVVTLTLLVFMWTWNEFLLPLVMVTDESLRTAPLGLAFFKGQYTAGTSLLAAGAVLVALPVLLLYLVAQRHFIRGMVDGSLKG